VLDHIIGSQRKARLKIVSCQKTKLECNKQ